MVFYDVLFLYKEQELTIWEENIIKVLLNEIND